MNRRYQSIPIAAILIAGVPNIAVAGMPSVTLSDVARLRFSTISFFLIAFLASSWVVRWLWNSARKDFLRLPYLSYRRALTLVSLWGLLFLLVLTMISGARELMTPGAWKKDGLTYKLKDEDDPAKAVASRLIAERRAALDRLRAALWTYARHHDGHFPPNDSPTEIPDDTWRVPDPSGMRYLYTPGLVADKGNSPLVHEPAIFGPARLVLLSSGQIVSLTEAEAPETGKAP
jgi:hypothetical protein